VNPPFPESSLPPPKKSSLIALAIVAVLGFIGLCYYLFPPAPTPAPPPSAPGTGTPNPLNSLQKSNPFAPAKGTQ